MRNTVKILILLVVFLLFVSLNMVFSKTWNAYIFKKPSSYTYKLTDKSSNKVQYFTVEYVGKTKSGNYKFRYSVELERNAEDIRNSGIFSLLPSLPSGLMLLSSMPAAIFILPTVYSSFQQFDLSVGSKVTIFGTGFLKVDGKKKIAGIDGFEVNLYDMNGRKSITWVINPDVPLPLEVTTYDETTGKPSFDLSMVKMK